MASRWLVPVMEKRWRSAVPKSLAVKKELFEESIRFVAQQWPCTELNEVSRVPRRSAPPCCKRVAGEDLSVACKKQFRGWWAEAFFSRIEGGTGRADLPRDTYLLPGGRTGTPVRQLHLDRHRMAEENAVCRYYRQLE